MAVGRLVRRLVTPRPRSRFTRGSLYRVRLSQNRFESWRENQGIVPLQSIRRYLPGFRPEYLPYRFDRLLRLTRFPGTLFLLFKDRLNNLVMIPYRRPWPPAVAFARRRCASRSPCGDERLSPPYWCCVCHPAAVAGCRSGFAPPAPQAGCWSECPYHIMFLIRDTH